MSSSFWINVKESDWIRNIEKTDLVKVVNRIDIFQTQVSFQLSSDEEFPALTKMKNQAPRTR